MFDILQTWQKKFKKIIIFFHISLNNREREKRRPTNGHTTIDEGEAVDDERWCGTVLVGAVHTLEERKIERKR